MNLMFQIKETIQIFVGCERATIRNKQLHRKDEQKGLQVLLDK
jgi:hypothetical protein